VYDKYGELEGLEDDITLREAGVRLVARVRYAVQSGRLHSKDESRKGLAEPSIGFA